MDHHNVRRKDTTKGPPLRVLSLDGGGVRGYSMLIILQELMYRAYVETEGKPPKRDEIPKPCEYFDMIAGTGTGGLIAIMLGRLRLDIETCMDVYVRMTKKVFETDKTIAGIPYKQTLFKASKLEEAIRQCVAEHTLERREVIGYQLVQPYESRGEVDEFEEQQLACPDESSQHASYLNVQPRTWLRADTNAMGNPEASLYDNRENRTKTAVTAVYKGTNPRNGSAILLRSYDSRKEPAPEFNCTIWQAGRATSATGLAFKPIHIGQSVFIDEGAGKYNPSPQILEEAVVNEYPGRDLGIFVSIGTGKRPPGTNSSQSEWWEGFVGGSVGSFAEARRRLIAKIEACEDTHVQMLNNDLPKYQVPRENYARLNVEVGVGEFGMNEWDRLSDMTIGTRRYLKKGDTQEIIQNAAYRLAKIHLMHRRMTQSQHMRVPSWHEPQQNLDERINQQQQGEQHSQQQGQQRESWPAAVELPAEPVSTTLSGSHPSPSRNPIQQPQIQFRTPSNPNPPYPDDHQSYSSRHSSNEKIAVLDPGTHNIQSSSSGGRHSHESARLSAPAQNDKFSVASSDYQTAMTGEAPPRPPKTPINEGGAPGYAMGGGGVSPLRTSPMFRQNVGMGQGMGQGMGSGNRLPYPVDGEGPPPVNKLRKPQYTPS